MPREAAVEEAQVMHRVSTDAPFVQRVGVPPSVQLEAEKKEVHVSYFESLVGQAGSRYANLDMYISSKLGGRPPRGARLGLLVCRRCVIPR
jgi:hypothetical protein